MDATHGQSHRINIPSMRYSGNVAYEDQSNTVCQNSCCKHQSRNSIARQPKLTNLAGKDLIIRMLAEIFQISRNEETGQLKWRQISTSLVPVSLYSRTTGKWLDYLSAASSITLGQKQSAMSPDSRHLLLLMQQFHQQTRATRNQSTSKDVEYDDSTIVFQVVAHDSFDGKCKTILNAKIAQPGTRLGQASDYFVYWREQNLSQTGCTNLPTRGYNDRFAQARCPIDSPSEAKTWGLNFASINDANLFYDICSLNLVDLDFNSDYLKLLALSDRNQPQHYRQTHLKVDNVYPQQVRYVFNEHDDQQVDQSRHRISQSQLQSRQRCPACREIEAKRLQSQHQHHQQAARYNCNRPCPVHHTMRVRSRSSSRAHNVQVPGAAGFIDTDGQMTQMHALRSQSFSTPTSPERKAQGAPITSRQLPVKNAQLSARSCSVGRDTVGPKDQGEGPNKPIRGVLRDSMTSSQVKEAGLASEPSFQGGITGSGSRPPLEGTMNEAHSRDIDDSDETDLNAQIFVGSRMAMRRSTGIDSSNIRQFNNSFGSNHRTARLARAQFANSKMTKDFLSLDVGNCNQVASEIRQDVNLGKLEAPKQMSTNQNENLKLVKSETVDQSVREAKREVATTTDDLPLDCQTRRRMFDSTSNDTVREAQYLGGGQELDDGLRQANIHEAKSNVTNELKLRFQGTSDLAGSMQTAVKGQARGTDASSRRRSLERTSCVDLDVPMQTPKSRSNQHNRLSPLAQSNSSPNSMSGLEGSQTQQTSSRPKQRTQDLGASQITGVTLSSSGPNSRTRTKSSGESSCRHSQRYPAQAVLCQHHQQLAKSAPDVSVTAGKNHPIQQSRIREYNNAIINYNSIMDRNHAHSKVPVSCYVNELKGDDRNSHGMGPQSYRAHFSSYAAPLCWEKEADFGCDGRDMMRQYHSCPNSLRRKRRDGSSTIRMVDSHEPGAHWLDPLAAVPDFEPTRGSLNQRQSTGGGICKCQHQFASRVKNFDQHSGMRRTAENSPYHMNGLAIGTQLENSTGLAMRDSNALNWMNQQQQQQQRQQEQQQLQLQLKRQMRSEFGQQGQSCSDLVYDPSSMMINDQRCPLSQFDRGGGGVGVGGCRRSFMHYNKPLAGPAEIEIPQQPCVSRLTQDGHLRPGSSLGSRSPLHYGLYESDFDDNGDENWDDTRTQARAMKASENDYIPMRQDSSYLMEHGDLLDSLAISTALERSRSVYFRPNVEPVEGYDLCLDRQALRTRPRARSQPPARETFSEAAYLARSVENVRKLVREVQLELDALKRESSIGRGARGTTSHEFGPEDGKRARFEAGVGEIIQPFEHRNPRKTVEKLSDVNHRTSPDHELDDRGCKVSPRRDLCKFL